MSLLEIQVIEIEEDLDDLDQDVNFLFDDQVIQNERIFELETTSDQVEIELARINEDVEGMLNLVKKFPVKSRHIIEITLQNSFGSYYRSGTVNWKSFVGKVLLWIKWKFELN